MDALCYAIPARFAYMTIPADDLRVFADGMFPSFAKCPAADFIQGAAHRYIGGHDLLLDIPKTLVNRGPCRPGPASQSLGFHTWGSATGWNRSASPRAG